MILREDLFREIVDPLLQRELFAANIGRIEVETHSYCNRRCDYCPNVIGDRMGPNIQMRPEIYAKLLAGLAEINFAGHFVLNSYNEPLYDRAILERITEARAALPKARLMIYTNGDYLTPSYVTELAAAGLNYMHVSIHLKQGDVYTEAYVLNRIAEISHRTGLQARFEKVVPGSHIIAHFDTPLLTMETRALNFTRHGNDRGGLLPDLSPKTVRTAACSFVFNHFHIGFTGNVVPCCHIRSDRPEHAKHVIGNLGRAESIFDIAFSAKAAAWRRGLVHERAKAGPCATCTAPFIGGDERRKLFGKAYDMFVRPLEEAGPQLS